MAAPQIYRSSDGSAPVLTGTAGDLVNLLDKTLVSGYTGKAAAGWSKPYTATNAAVFRMGAGNQFYLDVNDNGASSGLTGASGKEAAVRGYEVMTAASTGTGPFPTTAQVAATDANWRKSATADATARAWVMVADDRSFILGILDGDTASRHKLYVFGDFYSMKPSDAYRVVINVKTVPNSAVTTGTFGGFTSSSSSGALVGLYVARIAAGTGTSVAASLLGVGSGALDVTTSFTGALDGNMYLARLMLHDGAATGILRGWLRGVWQMLQPVGWNHGDTFSGTGDLTGRTFLVIKNFVAAGNCIAVETTDWDVSS